MIEGAVLARRDVPDHAPHAHRHTFANAFKRLSFRP
jgi:hypothetical protein